MSNPWKKDFPGLGTLAYLDSAATSQKPVQVVEAMRTYYLEYCANVHRGAYALSSRATEAYEAARQKVSDFLGTRPEQCIFTRGTTESVNLLASSLGRQLPPGSRILLSVLEHHSNLVPWQQMAEQHGHELDWIEVDERGLLRADSLEAALDRRPAVLALTWVSNVTGAVHPIAEIARRCREQDTLLVVDGAQGVPHLPCSVEALGCDFLVFSGHKMLGPTGIGLLWGRQQPLESLPPYQYGGSMIERVTRERTTFAPLPQRFEAGTPPIAEAIGLGAAVDYLQAAGMDEIRRHEQQLLVPLLEVLAGQPDVHLVGPSDPEQQSGTVSFFLEGIHPHDLATVLDRLGVCIRAGHHCCQPLMRALTDHWKPGSRAPISLVRASVYLYNDESDVLRLAAGLQEARRIFCRVRS